jgi:hypothetical protein
VELGKISPEHLPNTLMRQKTTKMHETHNANKIESWYYFWAAFSSAKARTLCRREMASFSLSCWLAASADKKVVGALRFMFCLGVCGGLVARFSLCFRSWTPVQEERWANVDEEQKNPAERA